MQVLGYIQGQSVYFKSDNNALTANYKSTVTLQSLTSSERNINNAHPGMTGTDKLPIQGYIVPKSCKRRVCRRCKAARAQTYYGTSSPCQHRRFGKIGVPLRVNYFQKSQHLWPHRINACYANATFL